VREFITIEIISLGHRKENLGERKRRNDHNEGVTGVRKTLTSPYIIGTKRNPGKRGVQLYPNAGEGKRNL